MKTLKFFKGKVFPILDVVKFLLVLMLLIMFVNFNAQAAQQTADTHRIAESTNNVVKSQHDILDAIKKVTDDTRMTAAQQTAIIICMLQVPVSQRTTDLQAQCRDEVKVEDASSGAGTVSGSTDTTFECSSCNNTTTTNNTQSDSSQAPPAVQPSFLERLLSPVNNLLNRL